MPKTIVDVPSTKDGKAKPCCWNAQLGDIKITHRAKFFVGYIKCFSLCVSV